MPNWCMNNVSITAKTEEQKALLFRVSAAGEKDGFFQLFRPIGEWEYDKAVGLWGTKWDVEPLDIIFDGETLTTSFDSAWAPPIELYSYLVEEGFEVDASYYEPGMDFGGFFTNDYDDNCLEDLFDYWKNVDEAEWSEDFRELNEQWNLDEQFSEMEEEMLEDE